jgi:hypothetical protein
MHLTTRDEEIVMQISYDQRVSIQAAAYAVYAELTPNNKKPISQREFHRIFKDNWQAFGALENEESDED